MSTRRSISFAAVAVGIGVVAACGGSPRGGEARAPGSSASPPATGVIHGRRAPARRATARVAPAPGGHASASAPRILAGPSLTSWTPAFRAHRHPATDLSQAVIVDDYEVPLYTRAGGGTQAGLARLGAILPAEPTGQHCDGGEWVKVSGDAYACTGEGLILARSMRAARARIPKSRAAHPGKLMPYVYAKATIGAPRMNELPPGAADSAVKGVLERWMNGPYFLALWRKVEKHGEAYFETIQGRYVRADDLQLEPTPPMHGEELGGRYHLPLAFVLEDAELRCVDGHALEPCGRAEKHARFEATGAIDDDRGAWVLGPDGIAVAAEHVRVATRVDRPDGVPADARWIHIDLSTQSLVAYEGDEPVYVTLVSSGRPGHETPTGLFRIERKYVSKTMRGPDEKGWYEVQEVPWTMYFTGHFALHGAYWHDRFGRTKSHGCVNAPPVDARWLYYWSRDPLPAGWHADLDLDGAWVYVSGTTPPEEPPAAPETAGGKAG